MTPIKELQQLKDAALPVLKKAGITHSSFFGSVARGENRADSDIDILIDFDRKMTLFDLVRLQRELGETLGRKVDLVTRRSIYPPLKKYIEKDEVVIM